jgi:hypothetical protein
MGRKAPLAHRKLTWWLGVSQLGGGREKGVSK